MSAPMTPLSSEIDSLNDIKTVTEAAFQQCKDMIQDVLTYSSDDSGDLSRLKMHMTRIAESQKEIASLIHATNEICNLTDKVNLTEAEAIAKFEESLNEYMQDNDIDDSQKEVLFSLDSFVNNDQVSGPQREDSDLLVTKTTLSYKDPLTQRAMQDPVKSKLCKHSYERESIMTYLGDTKKKCPYSGCQSKLSRKDVVDDFVLKLKLSIKGDPN